MSQQGTPLGLILDLNQALMSSGTFSNCPRSIACAAVESASIKHIMTIGAVRRIGSSPQRCVHVSRGDRDDGCAAGESSFRPQLGTSVVRDACSNNEPALQCGIDAVRE
jgi:hypothetical protein